MNTPVSFPLAKLLPTKGVSLKSDLFYTDSYGLCSLGGDGECLYIHCHPISNKFEVFYDCNGEFEEGIRYNAPTIADVVMWLYEKHEIYIHISPHGDYETSLKDCKWWFSIYKDKAYNLQGGSGITEGIESFDSFTEAYEEGIKYVLTNLKI